MSSARRRCWRRTTACIQAQANYAVFRTKPGRLSEVYNVGRYIDEIVRTRLA